MKRKALTIGIAALLSLASGIGCKRTSEELLSSTSSPSRQYKVEISQRRDLSGDERYVYLSVYRNDQQFLRNKLLYTGDLLDEDFRTLYPKYSWVDESILKIGQTSSDSQSNSLRITNDSPNTISYLLVETYREKYVLFDVEPGAIINMTFQFLGQLSCQGVLASSQERFSGAVRLTSDSETSVPGDFSIRVRDKNVIVESPTLELKTVTCCAADRPDIYHE